MTAPRLGPELDEGIHDTSHGAADTEVSQVDAPDWVMWPPSPKMQIALIAIAFGLFNCLLLGIVAVVLVRAS